MNPGLPARALNLAGASNFRDLGGYVGQGGRALRWRRLFRSDHLAALTPQDLGQLAPLGLARVCDFRGEDEGAALACRLPGVPVHSLAIEPLVVRGLKDLLAAGQPVTVQQAEQLMQQTYQAFVRQEAPRFAALFGHLLENDAPLVFHCTAGKDRTGFAAALILLALGVPRPLVMGDYLLSNDLLRRPPSAPARVSAAVLAVLGQVREDYLDSALQLIETDYGGLDHYLAQQLQVGVAQRERLAALYLQP